MRHGKACLLIGLSALLSACQTTDRLPLQRTDTTLAKIAFDLERLDARGLYGPANGLRSLTYEFCIPAQQRYIDAVHGVDPDLRIYRQSPGRVGCHNDEYLCMGETHGKTWRQILTSLAALPYVERIIPSHYEF